MYRTSFKRFFDTLFSVFGLIVLLVPGLLISILIKVTSAGPVLFKQVRYGQDSKPFVMYKFRTMSQFAPEMSANKFTDVDEYITPLGAILRKTSLDEIPQLLNILNGTMSFIGPRPLAKADIKVVELRAQNGSDKSKPGITGLAQVNGRNLISDEEKAHFDSEYTNSITLIGDLKIVFLTIVRVFKQEGIYKDE